MWRRIKQFFIRLIHGSKLTFLSFQAYYYYKKLRVFPLLIAIGWTITLMAMVGLFFYEPFHHLYEHHKYLIGIPLSLLFFFVLSLINTFFQVAASHAVSDYCQTNKASVITSCWHSCKSIGRIIYWAAMEALIKGISTENQESSNSTTMIQFIKGTSWQYLSFFIYPIFACEQISLFDSLKRSTHLFKKYFGTVTGSIFTLSAFYSIFPYIVVGILCGTLLLLKLVEELLIIIGLGSFDEMLSSFGYDEKAATTYFIMGFLMPYFCLLFFFVGQIISTAQNVMSTLLYRHVTQQSTGFLRAEVLEEAIKELK